MSDLLFCAIESHMGKWNVSKYSAHVLPKPNEYDNPRSNTILNMLVHLADYLASRNFIDVVFE